MKIGLEVEFFVTQKGKLADASLAFLPHDDYPLIAEARGLPHDDRYQAVASVRGEIERIVDSCRDKKLRPVFENWWLIDDHVKALQLAALRRGLTKHVRWENMHGAPTSPKNEANLSAGLHVSFTNQRLVFNKGEEKIWANEMWDFLKTFAKIEKEFSKEIAASERVAGFYEIKSDGRIEYRSLPATLIKDRTFARRLSRCF